MLSKIIRKFLENLSFFYLNNMNEVEFKDKEITKLIKKKLVTDYNSEKNLKKTHLIFNQKIFNIINEKKLKNFLRFPFIQKMFFVHNRLFIWKELKILKADKNWKFYKKILVEDNVGDPVRYFLYPESSGNRINHVFHLNVIVNSLNLKLKLINNVFEFGGGYGCMARIFSKINSNVNYTIFDTKLVNFIQYYYLKLNKLNVGYDINKNYILIDKLKKSKKKKSISNSLFIANWSMSETPIKFRAKLILEMIKYEYILISFQENFEEINNLKYFKKLIYELKSKYKFKLIKNKFYKGNILKKEKHYFLVGKKLKI